MILRNYRDRTQQMPEAAFLSKALFSIDLTDSWIVPFLWNNNSSLKPLSHKPSYTSVKEGNTRQLTTGSFFTCEERRAYRV